MSDYKLGENAVLMRLSISLPGEQRHDAALTNEVQNQNHLGAKSGKWIKNLYPLEALKALKTLDAEARMYHSAVTLPYDQGIGILPNLLIPEYSAKMTELVQRRQFLRDEFLRDPQRWIDWAVKEHNGTFDPDFYPGCRKEVDASGERWTIDAEEFRKVMEPKFAFDTLPLPVPGSDHFSKTVADLLGVSTEKIDMRVRDAKEEARVEIMKRLIAPVAAMAKKLVEVPKGDKDIIFRDTLIGNIQDIARIAPALNLSGDAQIAAFVREVEALATYTPKDLRDDKAKRAEAAAKADALAKRMAAYKL